MPSSLNKPPLPPGTPPALSAPPPPPPSSIEFTTPIRRILTSEDLQTFQSSPSHALLLGFITDLNNSILNLPNSHPVEISSFVQKLLNILEKVRAYVDEFPPEEAAGSRFGNKSFWRFYDAIWERSKELHKELELPNDDSINEVKRYLCESFGNRTRIDYGSGHELNFITWLLCFRQLSLITPSDYPALILHLFNTYLSLMRHLQTTYYLEPAGSHGVWGLDDYQFLPFLFGSSQLYSHPYLRPKSIHNDEILEELSGEYIYLSCISFINSIKTTAGLRWHSPMLDDISAARNWAKINQGMLKMYEKEVLGKLPVMQHFLFGGIVTAEESMGREEGEEGVVVDREGLRHVHSTWGECCGIKVPAAVAARKEGEKETLRRVPRIPFD